MFAMHRATLLKIFFNEWWSNDLFLTKSSSAYKTKKLSEYPPSIPVGVSITLLNHFCFNVLGSVFGDLIAKSCPTLATPWIIACQAPLSMGFFRLQHSRLPYSKLPSHPLAPPSSPVLNLSHHQGLFQWASRWPKYWSFSFSISPSSEYSGLISFRIDWFGLLAVQGTLKSLYHHSSEASILWHSAFFMIQLSHPHMTTGKTIAL